MTRRSFRLGAFLLLMTAVPGLAQDRAGLSLGATRSTLYGDDVARVGDPRWGFYGGAFGETRVADFLSLNLGVNYAQKGGEALFGTDLQDLESLDLELAYVELPLLVELVLPLSRTWDLLAYGGIAAAFHVSCKASLGGGDRQSCKDTPLGGPKTEWGLPVGGGLSYTLDDGEMVVFEARYTWGLNEAVSEADVRTRTWYFVVRLVKPT